MAQYSFEIVTIIAVCVIGVILAIYITILKRGGWLDRSGQFYRCSNQECRKVFRKPVELKDLSETPARVYPACPHCGTNLETVLALCIERKPRLEAKIPLQKKRTEIKTKNSASILKDRLNTSKKLTEKSYISINQSNKTPLKIEIKKPMTGEKAESPHKKSSNPANEKIIRSDQVYSSQTRNIDLTPTRAQIAKTVNAALHPSGCQYGYGYLSQREKGEGIPDSCIECPKSLDCMLPRYLKKEESVKEIKKWYVP